MKAAGVLYLAYLFLSGRPDWTKWQRRVTGSALGLVALLTRAGST
jgi:hypothetical protein